MWFWQVINQRNKELVAITVKQGTTVSDTEKQEVMSHAYHNAANQQVRWTVKRESMPVSVYRLTRHAALQVML